MLPSTFSKAAILQAISLYFTQKCTTFLDWSSLHCKFSPIFLSGLTKLHVSSPPSLPHFHNDPRGGSKPMIFPLRALFQFPPRFTFLWKFLACPSSLAFSPLCCWSHFVCRCHCSASERSWHACAAPRCALCGLTTPTEAFSRSHNTRPAPQTPLPPSSAASTRRTRNPPTKKN